ncbi:MAG: phosphoglucosamine mutase [Gammaproteobacteria bacterium]|nr:phosphoglucosamine mutase [Gammaproteobacteria bacterium]MCZ6796916.1 phosphoglucosamine mutase [Gammaproteobacteria bacterium]
MSRRYFGTDGIRGKVGVLPMTVEFVMKIGWAAGKVLSRKNRGFVIIGKDTRISGYMFESALEAGLAAAGLNVMLLGPMPTPAVAHLTRAQRASAGIVISASHNPYHDDGVKFFNGLGFKLADETEKAIEDMIDSPLEMVESVHIGKASRMDDAKGRYIEFCKSSIPFNANLRGMKIVVDCAHGATYHIAPAVFRELGADVVEIGTSPDGLNINQGVGAMYPENMRSVVLENSADIGIAFDGDGDRLIMMDSKGNIKDGDQLLYVIAKSKLADRRRSGGVVGTLMTNLGLEHALEKESIPFERANVGDRSVMEKLIEHGWYLGGETSGHIICLDKTTTGDGIIAALQVLDWLVNKGLSLADACIGMDLYPQTLINVPVTDKIDLAVPSIQEAVRAAESELAGTGRVLLRASGTEPLIRVMVEGQDDSLVDKLASELATSISESIPT